MESESDEVENNMGTKEESEKINYKLCALMARTIVVLINLQKRMVWLNAVSSVMKFYLV